MKDICLLIFIISLFGCSKTKEKSSGTPPNIVLILADDLGYGDVSHMNPESKISTPNIDRLADSGLTFTDAHTTSSVCTPTRYGILTGRYNWRTRLKSHVLWSYDTAIIDRSTTTIAEMLQAKGYTTGCIGKWHLGWTWNNVESGPENIDYTKPISNGPTNHGFDYFFGIKASLDIPPYVYVENDTPTAPPDRYTENTGLKIWRNGPTGSDFVHEEVLPTFKRQAVNFIDEQVGSGQPFFLYFPLSAPHTPILPTEEFQGASNLTPYGDFVIMVDDVVGEITEALERNGIRDNTLLIFTSDNGCAPWADIESMEDLGHYPSYIYRGYKADIYEGGHRMPFIVNWPDQIKEERSSDETICTTDLMATFADLLDIELQSDQAVDSYSFLPILKDKQQGSTQRESTIHHSINGSFAIRKGPWKLIMAGGSGGWSFPAPGEHQAALDTLPPIQLYDLKNDHGEQNNLQAEQPGIVEELKSELNEIILKGRSTPGPEQQNDTGDHWEELWWLE